MKTKILTFGVILSMAAWMTACSSSEGNSDTANVEQIEEAELADVNIEEALNSANTDDVLKGYDSVVAKYNEVVEKMKNGDTSVVEEYNKLTEWLNTYKEKLEGLKGSMTEEQAKLFDAAVSKAGDLAGTAESVVAAIKGDAAAQANEVVEEAKAKAGEAVEEAKAKAAEKAQEAVDNAKAKASEKVEEAKAKAAEKASEAVSGGLEKLKGLK